MGLKLADVHFSFRGEMTPQNIPLAETRDKPLLISFLGEKRLVTRNV